MVYNQRIDMWSLGCIIAELLTGHPLFMGENEQEQIACIMEIFGVPEKSMISQCSRRKLFFDSVGNPRIHVSSKNVKRYPATKSLHKALKTSNEVLLDFISKCLIWNPRNRMMPHQGLRHEFITGVPELHNGQPQASRNASYSSLSSMGSALSNNLGLEKTHSLNSVGSFASSESSFHPRMPQPPAHGEGIHQKEIRPLPHIPPNGGARRDPTSIALAQNEQKSSELAHASSVKYGGITQQQQQQQKQSSHPNGPRAAPIEGSNRSVSGSQLFKNSVLEHGNEVGQMRNYGAQSSTKLNSAGNSVNSMHTAKHTNSFKGSCNSSPSTTPYPLVPTKSRGSVMSVSSMGSALQQTSSAKTYASSKYSGSRRGSATSKTG